ncbi:hypothetical protein B0O99DRAFT_594742 [Bisporella sp. PMI_857]|nr:hypothetical protein B0O99DRAFT_594742 [Bisporella sp. PMI_857]
MLLRCLFVYTSNIPRENLRAVDQPIILVNASRILSPIEIPHFLCTSKQKFHGLLRILFRAQPWHTKVDRKEYLLEDKGLTAVVRAENWRQTVIPGAEICMSMIFKRQSAISDSCCPSPSCRASNIERISQGKKIRCCGLVSDFVKIKRVVELPDERSDSSTEDLSSENVNQSDEEEGFLRIRYVYAVKVIPTVERDIRSAFKDFATRQRHIVERARFARSKDDREARIMELKRFADNFKLPTPVPTDLVSIVTTDKVRNYKPSR